MTDNLQNKTCNLKNIECYDIVFDTYDEDKKKDEELLNKKLQLSFDRLDRLSDRLESIVYTTNNFLNSHSSLVDKIEYYKKLVKLESLIL